MEKLPDFKQKLIVTKAKLFLYGCGAFVIGVAIGSWFSVPWIILYVVGLTALVVVIFGWKQILWRVVGVCSLAIILGVVRYDFSLPRQSPATIQFYAGQTVGFLGVVSTEPDVRSDHANLTITVQSGSQNVPSDIGGRVIVYMPLYPAYRYGDLVEIKCKLQAPASSTELDSGLLRNFSYAKYLARFNIYSICYQPNVHLVAHGRGNVILASLLGTKARFIESIQSALPEPQASFLGGLILGAKKSIPDGLMQAFNRTGTTHIVALSGYNITIIAVVVMQFCRALWAPRRYSYLISLAAVGFFVAITGGQASVVRAGIMGTLVIVASQLGRLSRITNALALAAVLMLLINPKVLAFDTGFQLSFLATIGLVYLSPLIEPWFIKLPSIFSLKENAVATFSAIIMTTPLVLYQFGRLSIIAPLVNVLILPAIPLAMLCGFITGLVGMIWPIAGQVLGWFTWLVLSYIITVVETFGRMKLAAVQWTGITPALLFLAYGLIGAALWFCTKKIHRCKQ